MRRADMAMYLAKRQGKNRFVVFDEAARTPVIARTPDPVHKVAS
jgi:predicted signal transduction protein with EAL and GGDEF domain